MLLAGAMCAPIAVLPIRGQSDAPTRKPDYSLTAEELIRELFDDQKAADKRYHGKILEVEGVVSSTLSSLKFPSFTLSGAKQNDKDVAAKNVDCEVLAVHAYEAALLTKGQKVKAIGKYAFGFAETGAALVNCEFKAITPSQAIKVRADELAQDFGKDTTAARKKYGEKTVVVEGTVADVQQDASDPAFSRLVFEGKEKPAVAATLFTTEVEGLPRGTQVWVRAQSVLAEKNRIDLYLALLIKSKK